MWTAATAGDRVSGSLFSRKGQMTGQGGITRSVLSFRARRSRGVSHPVILHFVAFCLLCALACLQMASAKMEVLFEDL